MNKNALDQMMIFTLEIFNLRSSHEKGKSSNQEGRKEDGKGSHEEGS